VQLPCAAAPGRGPYNRPSAASIYISSVGFHTKYAKRRPNGSAGCGPRPAAPCGQSAHQKPRQLPRVWSHCRVRYRGTKYVRESGIKRMHGSTKRAPQLPFRRR
jgi:hypothetical protein